MRLIVHSSERERWLAERATRVCGSEVAMMFGAGYAAKDSSVDPGVRKEQQRGQLVMVKAGLANEWTGDETSDTGADMEDSGFFQLRARRKWGWQMEPCGWLIEDAVCPQLAATPDFFVQAPWGMGVVQTKCSTTQAQEDCKPQKNGEPSTAAYANGAPLYYQLQIQAELAVTGLQWGALLVLHASGGKFKLRAYAVQRHDLIIARMRREAPIVMAEAAALAAGRLSV